MSEPKQRKLSTVMRATLEALPEWEHTIHRGATAAEIAAAGGTRRALGIAQQKGLANTYGAESQEGHTPRYYRTAAGTEALKSDGWTEPEPLPEAVHVHTSDGSAELSVEDAQTSVIHCVTSGGYRVEVDANRVYVAESDTDQTFTYVFPRSADIPEFPEPAVEFVTIPGLGRPVRADALTLAVKGVVAPKPSQKSPTMSSYGFPHGRYEVGGELYWFSFNRKLFHTDVRKRANGSWSRDIGLREVKTVAAAIAKDPKAALHRYSGETGSCGLCGRKLTNHESLLYGVGEKCARDAFGDDWEGEL